MEAAEEKEDSKKNNVKQTKRKTDKSGSNIAFYMGM